MTPGAFLLGLAEPFHYGVFLAIVFVPNHNCVGKAFAEKTAA